MTDSNQIIPPDKVLDRWAMQWINDDPEERFKLLALKAAQWGAEKERSLWLKAINSRVNGLRPRSSLMEKLETKQRKRA